jgi:hypothetical protein
MINHEKKRGRKGGREGGKKRKKEEKRERKSAGLGKKIHPTSYPFLRM